MCAARWGSATLNANWTLLDAVGISGLRASLPHSTPAVYTRHKYFHVLVFEELAFTASKPLLGTKQTLA